MSYTINLLLYIFTSGLTDFTFSVKTLDFKRHKLNDIFLIYLLFLKAVIAVILFNICFLRISFIFSTLALYFHILNFSIRWRFKRFSKLSWRKTNLSFLNYYYLANALINDTEYLNTLLSVDFKICYRWKIECVLESPNLIIWSY